MEQTSFGEIEKLTKFDCMSKDELTRRYIVIEQELTRLVKENYELRGQPITPEQLIFVIDDQVDSLKDLLFGSKSERSRNRTNKNKSNTHPKPRVQKPSERYPHLTVVEKTISIDPPPFCGACGSGMSDSGMTEDSEQLNVIPKQYEIILQKRVKYRCECCHGDIHTAPAPVRIKEGSIYSDEMIIDASLSKYCDLIPMERYSSMAARSGVKDLPSHSLIECSHYLAEFLIDPFLKIKEEVFSSRVAHADETPHKMLEGSDKTNWFLWGFSTTRACFFECHSTRSGDVASEFLLRSQCEVLVSDVYSGYDRGIRLANEERLKKGLSLITGANCNTHARRYFFKADKRGLREAEYYLDQYSEIYRLVAQEKDKTPEEVLAIRSQMKPYFEAMKIKAIEDLHRFPNKNQFSKGLSYYLGNYQGLTFFLDHPDVPIDNNSQERLLRSYVIGRKTWYGTHSEQGAQTAAILFTLVESCKLNKINPREYFKAVVEEIKAGRPGFTPYQYKIRVIN